MIPHVEDTPEIQSLMRYVQNIQHLEFVEGAVTAAPILFLMVFLKTNSRIHLVVEAGFNCGYSAAAFLATRSDIK